MAESKSGDQLPLTLNRFAVTAKDGRVVLLFPPPRAIEPSAALQLAAWLIVGHELATNDGGGLELVRELINEIRSA